VPRWEAISRNASVVHGRAQWEERLAAYDHELAERYSRENGGAPPWVADRREAIAHLASFVGDLAGALEARPGRGRWSAHVDWLLGLLERYVDDAGAIAGAVADLVQLDAITGDVDAAGFLGAVTALLEGLRDRDVLGARQGAFGLRGITVVDVNSLRHLGFRAVAIVGVAERVFPPPPREDPLLLDARRQQLEAQHGLALTLRARGGDPEPLQFHTAVQAAGERLLISFARTATDGRGQLPSAFFRAAAETLAGERVTVERVDAGDVPGLRRLASGRLTPTAADTALTATERRRALLESRASGAVELVRHRLPRTVAGARAIRSRTERIATPFDGVLSATGLAALGDVPRFGRDLSPTSLETYARCPHRHLLANILGLHELEEPEAITRISALDKGDAVHRILESFLRERPAGPLEPNAERERLLAVAAPILRELEDQGRTGYPLLWDVDRIQILEDLERWLELDLASIADGAPRYAERGFEVRFGSHGRPEPDVRDALTRDEPLELALPSGHVLRIGGYVDRVDHDGIGSRRFEVIDYKTGRMYKMKDEALRGGIQLQLGLYLLAVARALGVPAVRGVARYVSVDRKSGFKEFTYPGALLEGDDAPLYALLDELVAARGAGDFHREPEDCTFCPVKGACEPRRGLLHARKATAPALVAHKARRETYP
jgi:ATP-dependent helicase/nuclease subunit B